MKRLRHVGSSASRPDTPDKASGRALYVGDLSRPGMLHGKIKFSEQASARIVHIDTTRAERVAGVRAVLTGENTPEIRFGFLRDNVALKRGRVRQFRDEVAAVAAIDAEAAAEAIELIEVEYEPLPAVFDPRLALAEDAPLVHQRDASGRARSSNRLPLDIGHSTGDLIAARRASRFIAEGEFSTPLIQQSCLGTAGCIAEFDARGNLTIWARTQIPFLAQRDFRNALATIGLRDRQCRVIVPTLGGAFGTGLDTHAYEYIAILLAHRSGRAVRVLYDRREEFACLSPRQSAEIHIEQGCDENGRLTFRRADVLQDNGAYTSWGATYPSVMLLPATSLYQVPVVSFHADIVYTNNTYCQAMRGYGNPELTWAIESNLDELARAAGIDALDMRLINVNRPGEVTPMGLRVSSCGLAECLETVGRRLEWSRRRGRERKLRRGIGIASLVHVGGGGRIYRSDGSGVILRFDDFGVVHVSTGAVEMGQGLHSALSLGVAEAVGVLPEQVVINETDTATCPWDVGTHASRGAYMALSAVMVAARKARERIFSFASEVFPAEVRRNLERQPDARLPEIDLDGTVAPERFDLADGELFLVDAPDEPLLRVGLDRLLRAMHFRGEGEMLTVEAFFDPPTELPDWQRGVGNMSATYAYGCQGAAVEVDTETGEVKLLGLVAAHDVGRVISRQALEGQIYGALAQGVGYALYEEVRTRQGRILNPSFLDYKIPTAAEMGFPVELEFIETRDEHGPFGAKGVGEPGLVPTAPAIANAIFDAIGVRIRDLPITPEKILAALSKAEPS